MHRPFRVAREPLESVQWLVLDAVWRYASVLHEDREMRRLANGGAKRTAVLHDEQRFFNPLVIIAL